MKLDGIPSALREALAVHEAFRRLGFSSDQIFFAVDEAQVAMVLRHIDQEFIVTCGPYAGTQLEIARDWQRLAEAAGSGALSEQDFETIYNESVVCRRKVEFVGALLSKGIRCPKRAN